MPFRTITAKYAGICRRCNRAIAPGQQIRYAGPRQTWHLKAECPATLDTMPDDPHEFHTLNDDDRISQADADAQPDAPTFDRSQMADF